MEAFLGFILTPWVFITLVAVSAIIQMIAIETENFGWNTFVLILLVLLLHAKFDLLTYISTNHPLSTIGWILGYFVFGLIWSFLKWYAKLSTIGRTIREAKKELEGNYDMNDSEQSVKFYFELKEILKTRGISLYRTAGNSEEQFKEHIHEAFPNLKENKGLIIAWIIYWPFSMVATAINDPIKRFADYLYRTFSNVFEAISTNIKNKVLKDI